MIEVLLAVVLFLSLLNLAALWRHVLTHKELEVETKPDKDYGRMVATLSDMNSKLLVAMLGGPPGTAGGRQAAAVIANADRARKSPFPTRPPLPLVAEESPGLRPGELDVEEGIGGALGGVGGSIGAPPPKEGSPEG